MTVHDTGNWVAKTISAAAGLAQLSNKVRLPSSLEAIPCSHAAIAGLYIPCGTLVWERQVRQGKAAHGREATDRLSLPTHSASSSPQCTQRPARLTNPALVILSHCHLRIVKLSCAKG